MKKFKVSEYITPKEAEIIIQSCPKERDRLILRTMWETGGRISEILSLVPDDIDQVNNCIYLKTLKQRTITGVHPLRRTYLFPESILCHDLLLYINENGIDKHDWLFQGKSKTGQVSTTYIWYLLSAQRGSSNSSIKWKRQDGIVTSLGIRKMKGEKRKPAWPHLFRHGAAMNIYRRTGRLDVTQHHLGHSSIMTTEGYAEMTDEDRKRIIDSSERESG